ncbi:MAG: terminase family protein [Pseudomonadota bacterium]
MTKPPKSSLWQQAYELACAERDRRRKLSQKYDWSKHARSNQLPPPGKWHTWLILAGRGFGKTRTGAETIRQWVQQGTAKRIALLGHTQADVRSVMIEGESGLLSVFPENKQPKYSPATGKVLWSNGATASSYSSDAYEHLRGPQFDAAWVDELAKFTYAQEAWDQLCLTLRIGLQPRAIVTTTPRPIPLLFQLVKSPSVAITRGSTFDNQDNLSPRFLEHVRENFSGTRLGNQELLGELHAMQDNTLWHPKMFACHRVATATELTRILVAIDPAASNSESSNETGIIVAGEGVDRRGYVLEDLSGRMSPTQWGTVAIDAYRRHQAEQIIAEVNNGGNMVTQVLKTIDAAVDVKSVYAQHSKTTRAEPIAALYEQGRISHVGSFTTLEEQLCNYQPGKKNCASDRMDALVWALTELFFGSPKDDAVSALVVSSVDAPRIS